jgi:hypothetical protein
MRAMSDYTQAALESAATTEDSDAVIVADDDGEIIEDESDDVDGRPDDCQCGAFHGDVSLPCWVCWQAGFETAVE